MVDQIASALAATHQQGVVHRDLKPANILLDGAGNAYLTDFGIAKDLTGEARFTVEGSIVGTLDYVSPEQIKSERVTLQTDIYSFGAVVYETLTGEKPFTDSSVANLIYSHLNQPIPQVSASRPDLPATVDDILQKATAKRPADRFENVLELAGAFRQAFASLRGPDLVSMVSEAPAVAELYNPYKGLRAFQEADVDDFFGRDALIEQLSPGSHPPRPSPWQGEGAPAQAVSWPWLVPVAAANPAPSRLGSFQLYARARSLVQTSGLWPRWRPERIPWTSWSWPCCPLPSIPRPAWCSQWNETCTACYAPSAASCRPMMFLPGIRPEGAAPSCCW
jgi:serine/threonine-protein kinase